MPYSAATWPSTLPKPEVAGFGIEMLQTHDVQEQMDGAPIFVTCWRLPAHPMQCTVLLKSTAQYKTLADFYTLTLMNGTAWFTISLGLGGQMRNALVHFDEIYTITQITSPMFYPSKPIGYRANFRLLIYQQFQDQIPWQP